MGVAMYLVAKERSDFGQRDAAACCRPALALAFGAETLNACVHKHMLARSAGLKELQCGEVMPRSRWQCH